MGEPRGVGLGVNRRGNAAPPGGLGVRDRGAAVRWWPRVLISLVAADFIVFIGSYDVAGLDPVIFTTFGGIFGAAMAFRIAENAKQAGDDVRRHRPRLRP